MPASKILLTIKTDSKEEETEIVGGFLTRLQYTPQSVTLHEKPDFEIVLNDKQIGIEVTKYYSDYTLKGSKLQQKLSEWKRFAEKLRSKLLTVDKGYVYLYGSIHFCNEDVNYSELLNDNYINELVILLQSIDLERTEQKTVKIQADKFPNLSRHIESIFFRDTYPEDVYLWWDSSLQSGQVLHNESSLKFIIDKKEESSKKYKKHYLQKWLIIYAGGKGLQDIFDRDSQNSYANSSIEISTDYFSHIYVWDKFTETIFQVYPYYKKIFDYGKKSIWIDHLPLKE
jgi:hypothetical protein